MADTGTFDLQGMLQAEMGGARVTDVNDDGSVKVTGPNGEGVLNVSQMLKDHGLDPNKVNIKYNDPMTAADGNHLSFGSKVKLALAGDKPQDKAKALSDIYSPEDLAMTKEGVAVREKGVWKKANSNLGAELVASIPEIAGSEFGGAAGAETGAMAGMALGGLPGAVVGAAGGFLLGGGLGMGIAHVIKDKGSEALGIKTEYDAEQARDVMAKDLGLSLAFNSVLGVAGYALPKVGGALVKTGKAALRAADVVTDAIPGVEVAKNIGEGVIKGSMAAGKSAGDALRGIGSPEAAQFLETMVPGTKREDWSTVMRNSENAKAVSDGIQQISKWAEQRAIDTSVTPSVDPVSAQMVNLAKDTMNTAKAKAQGNYAKALNTLTESGALDEARVDATSAAANFKKSLGELGLLERTPDGKTQVIRRAQGQQQAILQVFDPKSIGTLGKVYGQLENVLGPLKDGVTARQIGFEDSRAMLSGIDDILESAGQYNHSDSAMSNNARRALMQLRNELGQSVANSLENKGVMTKDGLVDAKSFWQEEVQGKYHAFRNLYDGMALPSKLGGSNEQLQNTVSRMLGEKGANLEGDFQGMLKLAGMNPQEILPKLQQQRAAINLADTYSSNRGYGSLLKTATGLGSPRVAAEQLAKRVQQRAATSSQRYAPISGVSKTALGSIANGAVLVNSLGTKDKINLISNPALMSHFGKTVLSSPYIYQGTSQQLQQQMGKQ